MSTASETSARLRKQFLDRVADPKEVWGCSYGFNKLNRITGGIQKGELSVLIADSNVGKSSLAGYIAKNVAQCAIDRGLFEKWEVRVVTLEMSGEAFQSRLACADSGVPRNRVKNGFVNKEQQEAYLQALDNLSSLPMRYIDTKGVSTFDDLKTSLTAEIGGKRCLYWVLDHFHICPKPRGSASDAPGFEETAKYLTNIARSVAPGLVLAQMTKESLKREDKRPKMEDVRYSSLLCNNADLVLGLYRDDKYNKWPSDRQGDPRPAELEVIKSRDGETGYVHLMFLPDRLMWVEVE